MGTDQILDLFNVSASDSVDGAGAGSADIGSFGLDSAADDVVEDNAVDATGAVRERGKKGLLDDLTDLWDERQYAEEYDLDAFLKTMRP